MSVQRRLEPVTLGNRTTPVNLLLSDDTGNLTVSSGSHAEVIFPAGRAFRSAPNNDALKAPTHLENPAPSVDSSHVFLASLRSHSSPDWSKVRCWFFTEQRVPGSSSEGHS
jgi:hypothetical protein